MIRVEKHANSYSNSNTYILYLEENVDAWVIDPGDFSFIINWLIANNKKLIGIILTHSHIDHIYGINDLQKRFPYVKVHASENTKIGMLSAKLNLSHFHGFPYVVERQDVVIIQDKEKLELWNDVFITAYHTPGHNDECFSYEIDNQLFTGDSLIPGIKVFTKFKGGNPIKAANSIQWIFDTFPESQIIYPGHGEVTVLKNINILELI